MPDLHEPLPEHVTTPLLTLLTARSMDEDYAHVAARRSTSPREPESPRRGTVALGTLLTIAMFGVLATIATVQTNRDSEVDELGRAALISRIQARRAELVDLQAEVNNLGTANQSAVARGATLQDQLADMRATVTQLEVPSGFTPVHGEGIRITVNSAVGADVDDEVRDEDLATLVDGLWEAGAEAIAINDERLTATGGIRNTGRAIHVNGNPVNAPYVISVIGDNATLEARLLETSQGQVWFTLVNGLGFRYSVQKVDDLRLPGATLGPLRDVIVSDLSPNGMPEGEEGAP